MWISLEKRRAGTTIPIPSINCGILLELYDSTYLRNCKYLDIPTEEGEIPWSEYWVILKSGAVWYKRETNIAGGYFKLYYSNNYGLTWDELFTLDVTEDAPIIDLAHIYRHRIFGTVYYVDRALTPLGYAGLEDTDWENIYST
jgi:hypothetical protein